MCSLTYLPNPKGFIVTQNRDESPLRGTPVFPFRNEEGYTFPKDPDGDGSWMMTDGKTVVCVLNGGFEPHERVPPYRHSRGLLPKVILDRDDQSLTPEDAQGLEPFSVFIFSSDRVSRYTWDAEMLYHESFSPSLPHIFQSAPLYSPAMQSMRTLWFEAWLEENESRPEPILDFHFNGGDGSGETNICMYRPGVQTTAITQVVVSTTEQCRYYYHSILSGDELTVDI